MAKPTKRRTGRKTAVKTAVALVPQPHGGALHRGGVPGNPGGGRPRSEVRAAALEGADVAIPKLIAILKHPKSKPMARIQAADKLLKYGLGTVREVSVDEVKDRLRRTVEVIRAELPPEDAERILARLRPIWAP